MTARWDLANELTFLEAIPATTITDTTPAVGNEIDMRLYPNARVAFVNIVSAYTAHGVTFLVEDAADDGGSSDTYATAATRVNGSLTKISEAGNRNVSFRPVAGRPWVRLTATGDSADVDLTFYSLAVMADAQTFGEF